jgi:hypothetical protein
MKKIKLNQVQYLASFFIFFNYGFLLSQSINIDEINSSKNHVPNIIPPSPSVSGLMKFEEIPVSNYTGVPDISIPLFSDNTFFGLNISVGISYHTASVKKNDVASSTGLGWSLMAGGTISRTVMGLPDEYYDSSTGKCGIYHVSNNFYTVLNLVNNNNLYDPELTNHLETNKFMFEANEKQIFDTKHDLYQYNFLGRSGRFIIKKVENEYQVIKLDYNNLKIVYVKNSSINQFEITDEQGLKYLFDVKESSSCFSNSLSEYPGAVYSSNMSFNYEYVSAFHLSSIKKETITIAEFEYTNHSESENYKEGSKIGATILNVLHSGTENSLSDFFGYNHPEYPTPIGVIQPKISFNYNNIIASSKKIKKISIPNKAYVYFNYNKGLRNDINLLSIENAPNLHTIIIKNNNDIEVKKYEFEYNFSLPKLFLNKIAEKYPDNGSIQKYEFLYDRPELNPNEFNADYWGYYKTKYCNEYVDGMEVDYSTVTKDVLIQIKYPTGGATRFEFESNTYAYNGSTLINDQNLLNNGFPSFDENINNFTYQTLGQIIPAANHDRDVEILVERHVCPEFLLMYGDVGSISLRKKNSSGVIIDTYQLGPTIVDANYHQLCDNIKIKLEAGFHYDISFQWLLIGNYSNPCSNVTINSIPNVIIKEKIRNSQTIQELFGGGFRVKAINYVESYNLSNHPSNIVKSMQYRYLHPDGNSINKRSSGSLLFPKPLYEYQNKRRFKRHGFRGCGFDIGDGENGYANNTYVTYYDPILEYNVKTSFDNVQTITTQGSFVGYQYVQVFEENNGVSEYTYTSPIDFPEYPHHLAIKYPFVSVPSKDYKRGLIKKIVVKDQSNKPLTETSYTYDLNDEFVYTGFSTFYKTLDCPHTANFLNYEEFKSAMDNLVTQFSLISGQTEQYIRNHPEVAQSYLHLLPNTYSSKLFNCLCCGIDSKDFIGIFKNQDIIGISQQIKSVSKSFFYENNLVIQTENESNLYYHETNYQVNKIIDVVNGESLEKRIFYPGDFEVSTLPNVNVMLQKNLVTTPLKVDVFRNNSILSSQKTHFDLNSTNQLLLPSFIFTKKGNELSVSDHLNISFDLYDNFGNLLQYTQFQNSTKTSYIWGYNHTLPVAKIENIAYNAIPSELITNIQNITSPPNNQNNIPFVINDVQLTSALNDLRTALPNALVTTIKHIPLVGVKEVIDPKGDKVTYEYDNFNRLKTVKDKEGNLVSENQYHYRP